MFEDVYPKPDYSLRLCKDCKWMRNPGKYAECFAPQNKKILATGFEPDYRYKFCTTHREGNWLDAVMTNSCGARGRWFKPMEAA